jgi:hypothetical protein
MRTIRILFVLASLASLAACASDKYSKVPDPAGPWQPANTDPASRDNNIIPNAGQGDLP